MPDLASTYALQTGLKIDRPVLYSAYCPVTHLQPYIIICTSSGMSAKNYDYYDDVIRLIGPILKEKGVRIVQVGKADDYQLEGTINFLGATQFAQLVYCIEHSIGVLSNDTSLAHIAGAKGKPLVALYGPTHPKIHGPHWFDSLKTILLESDRKGAKPSFQRDEHPKTINFIKPEEVAKSLCKVLDLPYKNGTKTIFIGDRYIDKILEVVPTSLFAPSKAFRVVNIRADYHFDEDMICNQLSMCRCSIVINQAINIGRLLPLRPNIENITYALDNDNNEEFVRGMRKAGIPYILVSAKKDKELKDLKLQYLDFNQVQKAATNEKSDPRLEKVIPLFNNTTKARSNKILVADGKRYLSKAHWKRGMPLPSSNEDVVIDDPDFWADLEFYMISNVDNITETA